MFISQLPMSRMEALKVVLHSIDDLGAVWYLLPPSPTQFGLGGSEKNSHCEIESQRLSANTSCNFCDRKNLKKVCRSGENSYNFANFGGGCVPETLAPARYSPAVFRGVSATQAEPAGARAAVQSTRGGEAEASPQLRNRPRLLSILSRLLRGTPSLKLLHGSCSWKLPQLKLRSAASGELTPLLAAKLKQPSWPRMLKLSKAS